jgi:hypothetical protein
MTAEDSQRFGEIVPLDIVDRQARQRLVGIPGDDRSKQALLLPNSL